MSAQNQTLEEHKSTALVELEVAKMLNQVYQDVTQACNQLPDIQMTEEDSKQEELCTICYTSELSSEQSIHLSCGHDFHLSCVKQLLNHKWNTLQISFAFMSCPQCKQPIKAQELENELTPLQELKTSVEAMALKVAKS